MPYIRDLDRREVLRPSRTAAARDRAELCYQIACLQDDYLVIHGLSYASISDTIAAAEDAAAEVRRVVMGPYEEQKMRENGTLWMCIP